MFNRQTVQPMFDRPTLPPMVYLLWLPHCATYVRETGQFNRQIIGTINRRTALQLPEAQARRQALALIRRTRQPVELRQVEPAETDQAEGES